MSGLRSNPLLLFTVSLVAESPDAQNERARPSDASAPSIDAERIRAHVKFLASDLLEGRGTGQRGGDIAAEYIATQFAQYGLKPAGDNGTYMQKVPLVGVTTMPQRASASSDSPGWLTTGRPET